MTLPGEAEAAGGVGQEAGQDRRRRRGRRRRRRRSHPVGPAGDAGRLPAARPADAARHAVAGHPGGRDGAGRHLQGTVLNFGTGYFLPRAVTRPVLDVLEFAI